MHPLGYLRICLVKAGLFHILLRVLEWSAERCSGVTVSLLWQRDEVIQRCTDEDRHGGPGLVAVSGIKWTILVRGRVNAGNIESWDNTEP